MPRLIDRNLERQKPRNWSLQDYYTSRNKILIIRETGGLGDILMHRMMFEDIKETIPEAEIHFACPSRYHTAVTDHPFIDKVLDVATVNVRNYVYYHNTTSACARWEQTMAPFSGKHRSDIWADHCGITLTKHNMHLSLEKEYKQYGKDILARIRQGNEQLSVALCPISAMVVKNLMKDQMQGLVKGLRAMGRFVFALHTRPIPELQEIDCPVLYGQTIRQWMGIIQASDYVISVDTAGFHYAGGIGKPLMGIFTFADGKVYGHFYNFVLVQKHRDNGDWDCGPCYNWPSCPKTKAIPKPCLTLLTIPMMLEGAKEMFERWPIPLSI
jgi:ADP-heptose:LPS heptosyltransferase